jgi:hypothetical protein
MSERKPIIDPKWMNDPDLKNAEIALRRAAERARERARRYGHGIMIYEYGQVVEKHPDDYRK